jgi:hypothetical protein
LIIMGIEDRPTAEIDVPQQSPEFRLGTCVRRAFYDPYFGGPEGEQLTVFIGKALCKAFAELPRDDIYFLMGEEGQKVVVQAYEIFFGPMKQFDMQYFDRAVVLEALLAACVHRLQALDAEEALAATSPPSPVISVEEDGDTVEDLLSEQRELKARLKRAVAPKSAPEPSTAFERAAAAKFAPKPPAAAKFAPKPPAAPKSAPKPPAVPKFAPKPPAAPKSAPKPPTVPKSAPKPPAAAKFAPKPPAAAKFAPKPPAVPKSAPKAPIRRPFVRSRPGLKKEE